MKVRIPSAVEKWPDVGTKELPLRLRMPDGTWKVFGGGTGEPMYVRNGSGWVKVTSGGISTGTLTYTFEYSANDVFTGNRFIAPVGWSAEHRNNLEYTDSRNRPLGETTATNAASVFSASAVSSMGWIGDEFNTYSRYMDEFVCWYSLPLGMFIEDAETTMALLAINNPEHPAANAVLVKADVYPLLSGYSVEKRQVPWMNFYYRGETTLGLWPGVGALRLMGGTPDTYPEVMSWEGHGVHEVNVVRNRAFDRETGGTIVWTGNLNDAGVRNEVHGIAPKPVIPLMQTFLPQFFGFRDSLLYHLQTSPLASPVPMDLTVAGHTTHNTLDCQFRIVITYEYDA